MKTKHLIEYPISVLSYNIYYKSMLGIDENFLPKEKARENVKNQLVKISDNFRFIFGLQEAAVYDKILPEKIYNSKNYVVGKSGDEKIVTAWSKNFILIDTLTTDFHSGRPIQITLLNSFGIYYLVVNLHAPHETQNFGDYVGNTIVTTYSNKNYSNELIKIINTKINYFLRNKVFLLIYRVIILGDFNEFEKNTDVNKFNIKIGNKTLVMKSDINKVKSCCLPKLKYTCDYIFDSFVMPNLILGSMVQPASDHISVKAELI